MKSPDKELAALSCYSLGLMYYTEQGVIQDEVMAKKYLDKACDLDLRWCK